MYKSVPSDIKKIGLDTSLYQLHKHGRDESDFGMNNTSALFENGFGLYSTANLKKNIGPAKTEYFRVALTRTGGAVFDIGLEQYQASRNRMLFGIPGQIFSLHDVSDDFFTYYMLFTEKFIGDAFFIKSQKWQFPFLSYDGVQCFEVSDETADEIEHIFLRINEEIKAGKPQCGEVVRLFIQLILIYASRSYDTALLSKVGTTNSAQNLFSNYLKLVSQHFLTTRKVADYADMLHVSPDHLNRAIKACSDKTAHELIDEMMLMEAKAYLLHSQLTIAEIAYKLEFADPSHFNRFFKKLSGLTPSEFRNPSE